VNGGPDIWLDPDDGSVVVQGEWITTMPGRYRITYLDDGDHDGPVETRVRVPADLLRRAVLSQALGYRVRVRGETLTLHPADVDMILPVDETAAQR